MSVICNDNSASVIFNDNQDIFEISRDLKFQQVPTYIKFDFIL